MSMSNAAKTRRPRTNIHTNFVVIHGVQHVIGHVSHGKKIVGQAAPNVDHRVVMAELERLEAVYANSVVG